MDEDDINERSDDGGSFKENIDQPLGSLHSKVERSIDVVAKSAKLEEQALNGLRDADFAHGQVEMFNNALSDQDGSKFKRNAQNSISAYSGGASNRKENNVLKQVSQLEDEREKQEKIKNVAKKVVKKAVSKNKAVSKSKSKSPVASNNKVLESNNAI